MDRNNNNNKPDVTTASKVKDVSKLDDRYANDQIPHTVIVTNNSKQQGTMTDAEMKKRFLPDVNEHTANTRSTGTTDASIVVSQNIKDGRRTSKSGGIFDGQPAITDFRSASGTHKDGTYGREGTDRL